MRLIPKSHHFESDYTLIALCPEIQSNERTECKQPISFKFKNTKNQTFSRQVVFYTKLYSNTVNIRQINKLKRQTTNTKEYKQIITELIWK